MCIDYGTLSVLRQVKSSLDHDPHTKAKFIHAQARA